MDITHPGQTVNNETEIINIVVIQQNDDSDLIHPQDMLVSSDTHIPERQSIVNTSPAVRDYKLINCLSSCQGNDKSPSSSFSKSTPKANTSSRANLHKSQSLTVALSRDEVGYPSLDALKGDSVFNISSLSNINVSSSQVKQMESKSTCSPQQTVNSAPHSQRCGKSNRFSKHRSINIPKNHSGSDSLSPAVPVKNLTQSTIQSFTATPVMPIKNLEQSTIQSFTATPVMPVKNLEQSTIQSFTATPVMPIKNLEQPTIQSFTATPVMLVKNLGQSTIQSLIASPDSGFCTPSSSTKDESFAVAAFESTESSTPRSSREGKRDVWASFRETLPSNKFRKGAEEMETVDCENESPLDKSLNCVQWLQTYSRDDQLRPLTSPQSNQTSKLLEKLSCHNQIDQVSAQAVTSLASCTSTPSVSTQNTPALSNLQDRKVLQELDTNRCLGPTTVVQPKKPQYERPSYSYMDLIKIALKHSADGQLTVKEILTWIEDHFPYFKYKAKRSWKSSVRCNLSMHSDFTKVEDKKRGGKWKVADDAKSYLHRLPKPPVIKQTKVPAVTNVKPRRSGPLPILPRSVPYALVPIPLAAQGNPSQHLQQLQQQALQMLQTQNQFFQLPLQVHKKQQIQESVNTSQQLSSSSPLSTSQQIKPRLQQIAPKLQPEHSCLTWDPKTFIICGSTEGTFSSSGPNGCELVSRKFDIPQKPEQLTSSSVNTSSQTGIFPSSNVLQPVGIQIQPGNQSNEKKIVFYLKQHQDQNHLNKVTSSETKEHSSRCNTGDTRVSKVNFETPSKTRSVCKTVDKIQRSKSFDIGYKNVQIRPYNKCEKRRRAPIINLQSLLTEDKENEKNVRKKKLKDKLGVDLSSKIIDASGKTLPSRPDSAPTKCLIQQAWEQADFLNDSMEHGSGSFDRASSIPQNCKERGILNTKLVKKEYSGNLLNFFQRHMDHHTNQISRKIFQPIEIPETVKIKTDFHAPSSSIQLNECEKKSCRPRANKSENTKRRELPSRSSGSSQDLGCKTMQNIGIERSLSAGSEMSLEPQEWSVQDKQSNDFYMAKQHKPLKTLSASRIMFNGLPNVYQGFSSSSSPIVVKSVNTFSSSSVTSSPQDDFSQSSFPTPSPTKPRFYRTKSRRKQIHNPLTTDICSDSAMSLSSNPDKPKVGVSTDSAEKASPNAIWKNVCTNISPPCGTDQSNQTTSSPISGNPSPLDFARFLSNISSSPYKNPCLDSTTNLSVSQTDDENILLSFHLASQSSTNSAFNKGMNVQDSTQAMQRGLIFLSPQSAASTNLTSTPTFVTSDPHLYHSDPHLYPSDTNFLISSPPFSSSHCHKENISNSPTGHTLGHFLSLTNTPPAGDLSISSTPTHGIHLPQEMLHVPANSSGFLDSSLFDTLDSLMQNSLYEFKTP